MYPALFISPYFPCSSPCYTFHIYIFIYKHTYKKIQLLIILVKESKLDFGLETLFSNILFSVSLSRWHRAKRWYSYVCSTNRLWTPETVCHPARLVWYYTHSGCCIVHKAAVNYFKTYITFSSFWYVKNMWVDRALWISLYMSVTKWWNSWWTSDPREISVSFQMCSMD